MTSASRTTSAIVQVTQRFEVLNVSDGNAPKPKVAYQKQHPAKKFRQSGEKDLRHPNNRDQNTSAPSKSQKRKSNQHAKRDSQSHPPGTTNSSLTTKACLTFVQASFEQTVQQSNPSCNNDRQKVGYGPRRSKRFADSAPPSKQNSQNQRACRYPEQRQKYSSAVDEIPTIFGNFSLPRGEQGAAIAPIQHTQKPELPFNNGPRNKQRNREKSHMAKQNKKTGNNPNSAKGETSHYQNRKPHAQPDKIAGASMRPMSRQKVSKNLQECGFKAPNETVGKAKHMERHQNRKPHAKPATFVGASLRPMSRRKLGKNSKECGLKTNKTVDEAKHVERKDSSQKPQWHVSDKAFCDPTE